MWGKGREKLEQSWTEHGSLLCNTVARTSGRLLFGFYYWKEWLQVCLKADWHKTDKAACFEIACFTRLCKQLHLIQNKNKNKKSFDSPCWRTCSPVLMKMGHSTVATAIFLQMTTLFPEVCCRRWTTPCLSTPVPPHPVLPCPPTRQLEWRTSALYTMEVYWRSDISVLPYFCCVAVLPFVSSGRPQLTVEVHWRYFCTVLFLLCCFATLCVEWKTSAHSGGTLEIRYFCTVLFLLCCFITLCVEWKTSALYTVEVRWRIDISVRYFCSALFLLCCLTTLCVEWRTSALDTMEVHWRLDLSMPCFCCCLAAHCVEWKTVKINYR